MDQILFIYCSPSDQDRIRIDREHRALDAIIREHEAKQDITRLQAATLEDIIDALSKKNYSVLHFSGHGDHNTICLDSSHGNSIILDVDGIKTILTSISRKPRLIVFMSCYSYSMVSTLHELCPHIICVRKEADDNAAIDFSSLFYSLLMKTQDIRYSFSMAYLPLKGKIDVVHSSRPIDTSKSIHIEVVVGFHQVADIYIDIDESKEDILNLDIGMDNFVSILSRKLRVHKNIFLKARKNSMLSIGPYVGVFSWNDESRVICHKIMKIRDDIDSNIVEVWASFSVSYNDCTTAEYRSSPSPADPMNRRSLMVAREAYMDVFRKYFSANKMDKFGSEIIGNIYYLSKGAISGYLDEAENKITLEDYAGAVSNLEQALSSMHDVVDALALALTDRGAVVGSAH